MLRVRIALCICLWTISSLCYSDVPCPPNPCGVSGSERGTCEQLADWVVDGTVVSVTHGSVPYTTHFGPEVVSTRIWDRGNVVLGNVTLVKGSYPVANGVAVLRGASHCWEDLARIPDKHIGKSVRVYGTNRDGIFVRPGLMAFDLMADTETRLVAERNTKERRLELDQVDSIDCRIPGEQVPSNEIYYRRGKEFFDTDAYAAARNCFLNAQSSKDSSRYSQEACYYLGLMYELGKGVAKDLDAAKDWYSKAGL